MKKNSNPNLRPLFDLEGESDICEKENSLEAIDETPIDKQVRNRYEQDTRFRHHLAVWVMCIVPVWLGLVILLLALCGFRLASLEPPVLIALLATTTANVLGLAYIVLKGLFTPVRVGHRLE